MLKGQGFLNAYVAMEKKNQFAVDIASQMLIIIRLPVYISSFTFLS
jgi:hypothetical protein